MTTSMSFAPKNICHVGNAAAMYPACSVFKSAMYVGLSNVAVVTVIGTLRLALSSPTLITSGCVAWLPLESQATYL